MSISPTPPDRREPPPRLVIAVLSAAAYEERRAAILETWGRDALLRSDVDFVFLIGDPARKMPQRFGHCLYLPCPDDYRSLPQKLRWFCLWALAETAAPWLFKCDDDTYVRVDRLLDAIETPMWTRAAVGCADGKGDHFHGGAGYLLSRAAATAIAGGFTAATKGLEDWKARDALLASGLWFDHDDRFCFDTTRRPDPTNRQITCHYVSPELMRLLHDAFGPP